MPVFEYRCRECNTKFDVLHKSHNSQEEVVCPRCKSKDNKKLLSSFSASVSSGSHEHSFGGCEHGSCGMADSLGGCPSGMCGLN
ncbi:MAG: FmdB family zinc ribbon protein [Bacteroidota bacterium]|nr:zinc ribbon domain-containing protein [Ignavibacteria bacterium]MCU7498469.1 zinc ribbon domain-containing protein [Ignavibacteria bacterium]MCU7512633.1 zinc ribbon domain-containing protein [Ignavibacteria bacterium]MCU7521241.1 zinc ribbon domain-containing protein [Ignavibacteria bacterium]MCU7525035.1 zinc ribbon domain-containing protein [Ignavibacteria bacterium]